MGAGADPGAAPWKRRPGTGIRQLALPGVLRQALCTARGVDAAEAAVDGFDREPVLERNRPVLTPIPGIGPPLACRCSPTCAGVEFRHVCAAAWVAFPTCRSATAYRAGAPFHFPPPRNGGANMV